MTRTASFCRFALRYVPMVALGASLLLHVPMEAEAQQWRLEPELRVGGEYDDNAQLRVEEENIHEITGYILEGSAGLAYVTPRTTFEITPRLRSRVYDEEIDVDSDDQFLDLDWVHQTLKSEFLLRGDYSRESSRTAERADADIDEEDPDEIPIDETGITFFNQRRERIRLTPAWRYEFTERMSLRTGYTYTDTSYEQIAGIPLRDYTDNRVDLALARELSPRTEGYIKATARRYESDQGRDVDGVGLSIGIESDISETTRFQAEVGYEDSSSEEQLPTGTEEVSDANMTGNINLIRRLETITMLAQYRRDMSAGGSGRVSARDTLNLSLGKQFTERVSGKLGVRAYQTEGLGEEEAVTFEERDYAQFYAGLTVALSQTMLLEADYRYERVDQTSLDATADSNNFILWLVYQPTETVW